MPLSPEDLQDIATRTLAHYEQHAQSYWEGTRDHDVSQNIAALLQHMPGPPPFDLLDFGCGPGRDLQTFKAILISSLFFGIAHVVLQQSLTAFALGLVIGYLAVKTGSLLPCMLFHFVHNSLQLVAGLLLVKYGDVVLPGFVHIADSGHIVYHWSVVLMSGLVGAAILYWLHKSTRADGETEPQLSRPFETVCVTGTASVSN